MRFLSYLVGDPDPKSSYGLIKSNESSNSCELTQLKILQIGLYANFAGIYYFPILLMINELLPVSNLEVLSMPCYPITEVSDLIRSITTIPNKLKTIKLNEILCDDFKVLLEWK